MSFMVGLRFPRRLAVLLVLAALFASPVLGVEPRPRAEVRKSDFVATLASKIRVELSSLGRLWSKVGCIIDPNGVCSTDPVTPNILDLDAGCIIDPNGVTSCVN